MVFLSKTLSQGPRNQNYNLLIKARTMIPILHYYALGLKLSKNRLWGLFMEITFFKPTQHPTMIKEHLSLKMGEF